MLEDEMEFEDEEQEADALHVRKGKKKLSNM